MYNNDDKGDSDSESKISDVDKQRRGRGRRREVGKKTQTISGRMDVLNTARGETEFQHAARVDVKLFPISGRVWKFNFTAGETISNKHREEKRKRRGGGKEEEERGAGPNG